MQILINRTLMDQRDGGGWQSFLRLYAFSNVAEFLSIFLHIFDRVNRRGK